MAAVGDRNRAYECQTTLGHGDESETSAVVASYLGPATDEVLKKYGGYDENYDSNDRVQRDP